MNKAKVTDKDLQSMFQEAYGQSYATENELPSSTKGLKKPRNITSKKYTEFLMKYENLEKYIDKFNSTDLTYYFREKSRENGNWYTIRNMKRDMGIFKRLLADYPSMEICLMIEFLFESGQRYLPTKDLQPTVLASTWCNTVYSDAQKWADGEFNPDTPRKKLSVGERRNTEREYHKGSKSSMGEWGD